MVPRQAIPHLIVVRETSATIARSQDISFSTFVS
ncbi:hypothetical protein LINGRAPRIM_LOCUS2239 [Linum grandiflorum]